MGFIGAKLSNPELIEWLKTKENQSQVIKEALNEKRLKEIEKTTETTPEIVEIEQKGSSFRLKRVIV